MMIMNNRHNSREEGEDSQGEKKLHEPTKWMWKKKEKEKHFDWMENQGSHKMHDRQRFPARRANEWMNEFPEYQKCR